MELPSLPFKIPELQLPFDIPVLMHPPVDHFIIALPIVVLLLEIVNLIVKKRAIGVVSFFLIVLIAIASVAAYLTGSIDGKEAFEFLSPEGQEALKAHKILGTYLMLASGIVLLFKLLSSMIKRGMMKGLYLIVLIFFVVAILKQGKEGGELVYKYGANVQIVQKLDSELFDVKEELEELEEENKEKNDAKPLVIEEKTVEVKEPAIEVAEIKEETSSVVEDIKPLETKKVLEDIKEEVKEPVIETVEKKEDSSIVEETEKLNESVEENITTP